MRRPHALLNIIFSRRSIRRFRPSVVDRDVLRVIIEAAQSAPYYNQAYSFILVERADLREELHGICGGEAVRQAGAILVVCLDLHRVEALLDSLGVEHVLKADTYPVESILGVFETGMALMNAVLASEIMGYGTLVLDCGIFECERISEILKLPIGVIPLAILCIGERDERPPPRPRWPLENILHVDGYAPVSRKDVENYLGIVDKMLGSEGYLKKYADWTGSYRDYLAQRTLLTKDVRKIYEDISAFIRRRGFRV
jgi:FMN reductase (NADPH)